MLKKYDIAYIVVNNRGTRYTAREKLVCDMYEAMDGNETYVKMFHGVYMQ